MRSIRSLINQPVRQGTSVGLVVVVLVFIIWASQLFEQSRLRLTNIFFTTAQTSNNIVIVALDDESTSAYGRSPAEWSRTVYAGLVNRLTKSNARVIGFDLLFDVPTEGDSDLVKAIQDARGSDARSRVVMAAAGVTNSSESALERSVSYADARLPVQGFLDSVDYLGYVNVFPDVDGIQRRQLSFIQRGTVASVSFPIAIYLAYLRVPSSAMMQVLQSQGDMLRVASDRGIPVDRNGLWLQNFFGPPSNQARQAFPIISLHAVLSDQVDPQVFDNKIVLVGVINNSGTVDQYPVPSDNSGYMMAGVEILANAVETLIQNRIPYEQSSVAQLLTILALGLASSLIYAQLRWYWILPAMLIFMVGFVFLASLRFTSSDEIINLLDPLIVLALPVLGNLGVNITTEINRRREAEFLLTSVVELTRQHLGLERIASLLGANFQNLLQVSSVVIWLRDENKRSFELAYPLGSTPSSSNHFTNLIRQVEQEKRLVTDADQNVGIPIMWGTRLLGIVIAQMPSNQYPGRNQLHLLTALIREVAPALENAILYSQVQYQKTLLEGVWDRSPTGLALLNEHLEVEKENEAFYLVFQVEISKQWLDRALLTEEIRSAIRVSFQKPEPFRQELHLKNETYQMDFVPLTQFKQWLIIVNDVSALAEANRLKTRMIRMASHDLKNPLSRVLGYGDLILDIDREKHDLSEETRQFVTQIMQGAKQMNQIITDILDVERLRSGEIQREAVSLKFIVNEVISQHRPEVQTRHQSLNLVIPEEALPVFGNYRHISQAVTNLLSNAIKYTPEAGEISVRLSEINGNARLEVQDTGYGIPKDSQAKLFTEFYRVQSAATAHVSGTGLGLSLVKSVVEAHGGKISFQSDEGVGSTFTVEFPIYHS